MVVRLKNKISWILTFIVLAALITGCISNTAILKKKTEPKYAFSTGDHLVYEITFAQENQDKAVTNVLDMDVAHVDEKFIELHVRPKSILAGQSAVPPYTVTITPFGESVKTDFKGPVLREIQPEFPNGLKYPEKPVSSQDVWTDTIAQSGNYSTPKGIVDYSVSGDSVYTGIDPKLVSVKAGSYPCLGIRQDVNFTLIEKFDSENGTVYMTTTGKISGENWIDLSKGFLVKSDYNIKKKINSDDSDVMKAVGFKAFYREIPSNSRVSCELVQIGK